MDMRQWLDMHHLRWHEYLGRKSERPAGTRNTRVLRTTDGGIVLRLWYTNILTLYPDRITYLTDGFFTHTTKHRMNEYGPLRIWQHNFSWYYRDPVSNDIRSYEDGMTFDKRGVRIDHEGNKSRPTVGLYSDGITRVLCKEPEGEARSIG